MSRFDGLLKKYDEDEIEFFRKEYGDPSWNPPQYDAVIPEVEIIQSRIAKKSDNVPTGYVKFKPLFLSRKITTGHGPFKRVRIEEGLIFYPLIEYDEDYLGDVNSNIPDSLRNMVMLADWEMESQSIEGCKVTFDAISKHDEKYWTDDIKNEYEDKYLGDQDAPVN